MFERQLQVRPPVGRRSISILTAALAPIFLLAACDRLGSTADKGSVPFGAVQDSATAEASLVEPHRYFRNDLASTIRNAGHSCEVVKSYRQIEQKLKGSAIYKIDCLEYSYRLTIKNGKGRIERFTASVLRD